MTDYHPLIARAVEGLAKSTGEARRALYERARSALVAQLRGGRAGALRIGHHQGAAGARRGDPQGGSRGGAQGAQSTAPATPRVGRTPHRRRARRQIRARRRQRERPRRAAGRSPPLADTPAEASGPDAETADQSAPPRQPPAPQARNSCCARTSTGQPRAEGLPRRRQRVDDLGAAIAKAAQTARDTRDSYEPSHGRESRRPTN